MKLSNLPINLIQLSSILLLFSEILVRSSPISQKAEIEKQETFNSLKNFGIDDNIAYFRQDGDGDSEEKKETTTPFTVTFTTPRIFDFANGLNGILSGVGSLNLDKILAGSFEFIPPTVRGGVKNLLSSIVGRPVAHGYFPDPTTAVTTPSTTTAKTQKTSTTTTKATEATEAEVDNAEEDVDDF